MANRLCCAFVVAVIPIITACSSTGDWQRPSSNSDVSVFPVANDRFVIRYHGDPGMTSRVIREQLLYRAAELTLRSGFTYFMLQDTGSMASDLASPALYGSAGDVMGAWTGSPSKADLLDPCGPEMERGGGLTAVYTSTAVVRMLKGPGTLPRVFDARRLVTEFQAKTKQIQRLDVAR